MFKKRTVEDKLKEIDKLKKQRDSYLEISKSSNKTNSNLTDYVSELFDKN